MIAYFVIGATQQFDFLNERNVYMLMPFGLKNILLSRIGSARKKMFLDSGAYSAFSRGKMVNLNEYIEFIKNNKDLFGVYANLDVIGDYKGTMENQKIMEDAGLNPLPVFHYKTPYEILEEMVERYQYIALGGLVPLARKKSIMRKHLDSCFSIIRTRCKVHGFGVNSVWAWKRYPFYSVDATSWLSAQKYRRMGNGIHKRSKTVLGMKLHTEHYTELSDINLRIYLRYAEEATKLWERRGVKWEQ